METVKQEQETIKQPKFRTPAKPDTKCKFCGYTYKKRMANPVMCSSCKKRNFEVAI